MDKTDKCGVLDLKELTCKHNKITHIDNFSNSLNILNSEKSNNLYR